MDISTEIAAIQAASQGSAVRQPIVDALNKINSGTLPSVTSSDAGKVMKVNANGEWELGAAPSGGTIISKTITQNGIYNASSDNADGYNPVIVDVSGGGGDDPFALTDYIESNGTQWIDSGYKVSDNSRFEMIAELPTSNSLYACAFGVRAIGGDSPSAESCLLFARYNRDAVVVNFGSNAVVLVNGTNVYAQKAKYYLRKSNANIEIASGEIVGQFTNSSASATGAYNIYIFGLDQGGSNYGSSTNCIMKLYRFRIWENDTLVHEFVPWIDSSDVVCLKDTVTGDLFYNAGTGVFTYGTDS